jgi:hypothetical protein
MSRFNLAILVMVLFRVAPLLRLRPLPRNLLIRFGADSVAYFETMCRVPTSGD